MKQSRVRKGLAVAGMTLVASLSLLPQTAGAEKPAPKKPPVTTPAPTTPEPYLEYKLVDILVSSV